MRVHPLWRPISVGANAGRQAERVAHRQTRPGALEPHRASWAADYETVRHLIDVALAHRVVRIAHVGSTAVPGLLAKPVVDVDLTVEDVDDEGAYVPALVAAGFRLIFRDDLAGEAHRQLTLANPNTNLHVWNPGATEPRRHELFVRWLRTSAEDRERYATAKRAAANAAGAARYNDLKSAVAYDIYERAFLADPAHSHDPQPRNADASQPGRGTAPSPPRPNAPGRR